MKKSILKSLEPKSKSLFRFNNSDIKFKKGANINAGADPTTTNTTDPTITTTIAVTTF